MTSALNEDIICLEKWNRVVLDPENPRLNVAGNIAADDMPALIENLAELFYNDIRKTTYAVSFPLYPSRDFRKLCREEREIWSGFVSTIPEKLIALNLRIRKYGEFCYTCLIPFEETGRLAEQDYLKYRKAGASVFRGKSAGKTRGSASASLSPGNDDEKRFFIEMIHLIPVELKKTGFEIIRLSELSEINEKMVGRLARAIHSKYLAQVRKQVSPGDESYLGWIHKTGRNSEKVPADFDKLDKEIKASNYDNAYHIPAKLLSAGYKIRPVRKGYKPYALRLNDQEIETMANLEHLRWCWDKILNGWTFGPVRDNKKKIHPSLVPYDELAESEKEKDRALIRLIPSLLQDINYEAYPLNPEKLSRLPYALKPHSSINRLLEESRELNDQLHQLVELPPEAREIASLRNRKIEEAIKEIESGYNYAHYIQKSILPDELFVRECFPESFILFRPKDIVSGDFYFFSKSGPKVIFAAADCTGHGIPGAILSTIAYGILDQAVNELRINEPAAILSHLYSKIDHFLNREKQDEVLHDDLDIALCSLDTVTNKLKLAGVGLPVYMIAENRLTEYKPLNQRAGELATSINEFHEEEIKINSGDRLYLFSDGYADQFGGKNHKRFQRSRFRDLLLEICHSPMPEQNDLLYEEFERWRSENNEDQTDDILVIGITIC